MAQKKGLGRGIDAIFLDNEIEVEEEKGKLTLRLSQIDPTPGQPRKYFDPAALSELADSIAAHGVLQPILVRKVADDRYQIVAGERRWRAAKMAGLSDIPAVTVDIDEKTAAQMALIENIQREDLNPIEEAMGYMTLADEYRMTQEEISEKVGKSRSAIANVLRLLDLPEEVRDMVGNGELSAGHARTLLGLKDKNLTVKLAKEIVAKGLSVREVENAVKKLNRTAEKPKNEEENQVVVNYDEELAKRMRDCLGRQVKVVTGGKKKSVTLYFEDNDDLDELLKTLCGEDFLSQI